MFYKFLMNIVNNVSMYFLQSLQYYFFSFYENLIVVNLNIVVQ